MAVILTFLLALAANDPRAALLGRWEGTSLCTKARAACHDEHVVYHLSAGAEPDVVIMAAKKVVDGKELEMGTLDFHADFARRTMVADYDNGRVATRWTFTWTEKELRGVATLQPSGVVARNVLLHR